MIVQRKTREFAVRVVRFCRHLQDERREYVLGQQLLKSGTSIGANVAESANAQSGKDFLSKMNIALKEATETKYWLDILFESETISRQVYDPLYADACEIERLLTAIVKTTRNKLESNE